MIKYESVKVIEDRDWDKLVQETYGKPYSFQQQDDCKPRGVFPLTIPLEDYTDDDNDYSEDIPVVVNGPQMGVKFNTWLNKTIDSSLLLRDWEIEMFYQRNFYPDVQILANDLHKKGLIEAGEYEINIDW